MNWLAGPYNILADVNTTSVMRLGSTCTNGVQNFTTNLLFRDKMRITIFSNREVPANLLLKFSIPTNDYIERMSSILKKCVEEQNEQRVESTKVEIRVKENFGMTCPEFYNNEAISFHSSSKSVQK